LSPREEQRKLGVVLTPIRRLARRLNVAIVVSSLVGPVWAVVAAIALWRFAVQRWVPAAGALLALGGAAGTWFVARRKLITHPQAAVMVDRRANAGGLLLTRLETGIGEWEISLHALVAGLSPPRMNLARPAAAILLALAFLVAALWVPLPRRSAHPIHAAAASRVEELAQKLEAVAKEEPIEAEARKELERLREEAKQGAFDPADWEAADSLANQLDRKAEEAGSRLLKADEAAGSLAAAMDEARTLEVLTRERDELERALMDLSNGSAQSPDQAFDQALGRSPPAAAAGDSTLSDKPNQAGEAERQANGEPAQHNPAGQAPAASSDPRGAKQPSGSQAKPQGAEPRQPSTAKARQPGDPQAGTPPAKGQQGEGGQGRPPPTREQIEELRKALQQRRDGLAKAFGSGTGERRSATAGRPRRSPGGAGNAGAQGKRPSPGAPGEESAQGGGEEGAREGKASRTVKELGGEHASRMMKGAPTHGPGEDTGLVFAGRAEMDPTRLTKKALPEGSGGEGTELLGLVAADPQRPGGGKITPGSGSPALGEEAPANREQDYLPRNKTLIQRYFDSPK
jgi:hypothetical protein